ncbi:MAG: ATP-grasp domain-containing protein [Bacillaceae bacterium]|nr:ATP-grasp domain-containing protein [Bacillaceae bacterium]
MDEQQWLPHLKHVPTTARGDKLSMYSVALEGWRRGLNLKFFLVKRADKTEINYALSDDQREHKFAVSKGDKVTIDAMKISKSKILTKEYLHKAGVPVPLGRSFDAGVENTEILTYAATLGYPVVLKPTNGNLGKGVIPNIKNEEKLVGALEHVRNDLGYSEVVIEQYFAGEEYRIYVLGDQVLAATNRIPANVIGDGERSIKQLIEEKNKQRKNNPNLSSRPIKINKELRLNLEQGNRSITSIPNLGERIFLMNKSNVSAGGDPIDVTDQLTEEVKEVAINTCKAIPGLVHGGVDLIFNKETSKCAVIEVNTRPGIGVHLFPMEGKCRDIPKAIIDHYFPETKSNSLLYSNITFQFDTIFDLLSSGIVEEVLVPRAPSLEVTKTLTLEGDLKPSACRLLQKQALHMQLVVT